MRIRGTAWPFSGMIGIHEHDEKRDISAVHLVNNWCILGTAYSGAELRCLSEQPPQPVFDRDNYKLFLKFLAKRDANIEIIKSLVQ